ncbi:MAG TPA: GNAT family N-acetyltransferase, partial [Dehalococcoidia bacterium]|nr:GNAT family N-acetyltransferase [Dehalococcoidia bacterium]
ERWGLPIVSVEREYLPADVEGLAWREGGDVLGLVTWAIEGERAEIVSLDALQEGRRIGGRLMEAAEAELRRRGVRTLRVVTTNDNPRALSFYVRRGYRLVRLHPDAMDRVRWLKPRVPLTGADGIPLRDMWELQREL